MAQEKGPRISMRHTLLYRNTIRISVKDLISAFPDQRLQVIGASDRGITHVAPIHEAESAEALSWVKGDSPLEASNKIRKSRAGVIACSRKLYFSESDFPDKTLVLVDNPRLFFAAVLRVFLVEKPKPQIHTTAIIHPEADIHPNVYIGPYTVIGRSKIDEGTVIHGHVFVYDNCIIGKNVTIFAMCTVGAEGFGFERTPDGKLEKFPHVGRLIIEDDVEIQAQCNLDLGTLGDTVIGEGTKIDTGCHLGHNSKIGKNCVIAAHTMVGARVIVDDYAWIAPQTTFQSDVSLGKHSFVGTASLLTKDVPPGLTVAGSPARPLAEYKALLKAWRKLAADIP